MANNPFDMLPTLPTFELTSADVPAGGEMPPAQRSGIMGVEGGEDVSPQLSWSGAPEETKSYVLTCYDPDAPTQAGFWHWAVANIPASTTELPANAGDPDAGLLPEGALTVPNDLRQPRFIGAAPPPGHGPHRYFFVLHALDVETLDDVTADSTPTFLSFNVFGHAIARAYLEVTFEQ